MNPGKTTSASPPPAPEQPAPGELRGQDAPGPANPLLVVGLGASAGGLETFERFFTAMAPDSGLAFVVVQHLDPDHASLLAELIQRYTTMTVAQAEDGVAVTPNRVWIIPPNRDLTIHQGRLQLFTPEARRGLRLPIDFFFRSLARDCGERAVAVVLSGTGTDGTLGLRAVKGEGGLAVVQRPDSAAYEGMPASALATGVADLVLRPEEMPAHLLRYARSRRGPPPMAAATDHPGPDPDLDRVLVLLREHTGHDFSQYKTPTLRRRTERRMVVNRIGDLDAYVELLRNDPAEVKALYREFLIRVTSFFRDREAFDLLAAKVIPALCDQRPPGQPIRVWVPGCASGEEAYSLALLLRRHLDGAGQRNPVQIFATDIDAEAVDGARSGVYPESISADVPQELLGRYFERRGSAWQVKKAVREMLVFAVQSVVRDPPFSNVDLITCRNLLIYLRPELQQRVLSVFRYVLVPGGWLLLGSAETLGALDSSFQTVDKTWRLYRHPGGVGGRPGPLRAWPHDPLSGTRTAGERAGASDPDPERGPLRDQVRRLTEQTLLDHHDSACLTIDHDASILYIQGQTAPFLETPRGEPTLSLLRLARGSLQPALASAVHRATRSEEPVRQAGVRVSHDHGDRLCHITVRPVLEPAALKGCLTVVLEDAGPVPQPPAETAGGGQDQAYLRQLEQELGDTRGYLQTTVEQLESTNEELTSANEELQSANEELQSTNEELQTSQEELRSVNEELLTVNSELQTKVEALDRASNDISNLMESTELAILFLDNDLQVRRFTPAVTRLVHLTEGDLGRPIAHIAHDLDAVALEDHGRRLLDTLQSREEEVRTRSGRWHLLRLRPYRTLDNTIKGVVFTFVDIHEQKRGEELKKLTRAIEQSPVSVIITDHDARIQYVNPHFCQLTGYRPEEVLGQNPRLFKSGEHPPEFYRELWATVTQGRVWRGRFRNRKKNGELFWESASISPVRDEEGRISHYVGVKEDITALTHLELELRTSETRYRSLVENLNAGVLVYDAVADGDDFVIREINATGERLGRVSRREVIGRPVTEVFPGVVGIGLLDALRRVWRSGVPEALGVVHYHDPERQLWVESYLYRLPAGEVVAIFDNVSDRVVRERSLSGQDLRRAHRILAGLSAWHREVAQLADTAAIAASMCRLLVERGDYFLAWVGRVEDGDPVTVHRLAQAGAAPGLADAPSPPGAGGDPEQSPTAAAVRTGHGVYLRHMDSDPLFADWREAVLTLGYRATAALPLLQGERVFAVLNLYSKDAAAFDPAEVALLEELAASLATVMAAATRERRP